MALQAWIYPVSEAITGSTTISQTDNKLTNAMTDLTSWLNATGAYINTGFVYQADTQLTTNQATFDASLITWQTQVDTIPLINVVNYVDQSTILAKKDITSVTYNADDKPTLVTYSGGWTVTATYVASGNGEGEIETVSFKQGATEIYNVAYTYNANDKIDTQTVTENNTLTQQEKHDIMTVAI